MAKTLSAQQLTKLSQPIQELLSRTPYNPPESHYVSIKTLLESFLSPKVSEIRARIRDFSLCCALLSSANSSTSLYVSWITEELSVAANSAFRAVSEAIYGGSGWDEKKLVIELIQDVMPLIKDTIKESAIDGSDEISAACARAPLGYAVVAAYQLRWFVTQIENQHLGRLCGLAVPCGLTAFDHWFSEVKEQRMISFIHLAKNASALELSCYGDVILDACQHNIVSSDEIWHLAVEMAVILVTCLQRNNPRSAWFGKLLNEMLGHLERQP